MSQQEGIDVTELLGKVLGWLRALIIGAFMLGMWAATLQWRIQNLSDQMAAIQADRDQSQMAYRIWQQQISTDVATTKNNVEWIRQEMQKRP